MDCEAGVLLFPPPNARVADIKDLLNSQTWQQGVLCISIALT